MSNLLQPLLLDADSRRLFAVYHPAAGQPRAGVVICPPFLHEHALSYRLFALLGDALAAQNVAVLRFDYHGTGDSAGGDEEFTMDSARDDAVRALSVLRDRAGSLPMFALGARAGALVGAALAAAVELQGLWFWQPVTDGAAYLDALRQRDDAERHSLIRYPNGGGMKDVGVRDTLLGFHCSNTLLEQLARARLQPDARWQRSAVLDANDTANALTTNHRIALGPALTAWADRVDMGHFPVPPVREVAKELATLAVSV
jgi:alpha/beta superfamily hydrolase